MRWNNPWNFTPRQCEALDAIIASDCDKQAAEKMGISYKTISVHISRALERSGARTRIQMILMWDRHIRDTARKLQQGETA
jgi:DNA-binding NarL/FixJ family response regulator